MLTEGGMKSLMPSRTSTAGAGAPASFYCPISMELMADPVMVATGHTYDRSATRVQNAFGFPEAERGFRITVDSLKTWCSAWMQMHLRTQREVLVTINTNRAVSILQAVYRTLARPRQQDLPCHRHATAPPGADSKFCPPQCYPGKRCPPQSS